jgi:hypothetical protein
MLPKHQQYIRDKFARAAVALEPFPHLHIRDVLPPELYQEMEAALPPPREVKSAIRHDQLRRWVRRAWRRPRPDPVYFYVSAEAKAGHLDRYAPEWQRRFGDYLVLVENLLHERFRIQEPWLSGQRVFFFRPAGWAIQPHVHPSAELTNTMIYFPSAQNTVEQGTLLYRPRANGALAASQVTVEHKREELEPVAIIPFLPNTLISWINTPTAMHGSIEIAGGAQRRYLYFVSLRKDH